MQIAGISKWQTYKPPSPSTIIRAIFARLGMFRACMIGSGKTPMAPLVKMLKAAFENLYNSIARQHVKSKKKKKKTIQDLTRVPLDSNSGQS